MNAMPAPTQESIKSMFNPENAAYEKLLADVLDDIDCGIIHSELDELTLGKDIVQLWAEFYFQTETIGESACSPICQHILECIDSLSASA